MSIFHALPTCKRSSARTRFPVLAALTAMWFLPALAQDLVLDFHVFPTNEPGASCLTAGNVVRGTNGTDVTYCYTISNRSTTESFSGVTLAVPYLGITNAIGVIGPSSDVSGTLTGTMIEDIVVVATADGTGGQSGPQSDDGRVLLDVAVDCPSACFVVSDVNNANAMDNLFIFDTITFTSTLVGSVSNAAGIEVRCLESLSFEPPVPGLIPSLLYSVETCRPGDLTNGYLGTIDWKDPLVDPSSVPGLFREVGGPIGSGTGIYNGTTQTLNMVDVDGIDFDVSGTNVILYACVRFPNPTDPDVLIQINTNTGAIVPGAFNGFDFVQLGPAVTTASGFPVTLYDVDDIAFNAVGQLWGVANQSGTADELVQYDKFTGAVVTNFPLRNSVGASFNDMEGLSFDPIRDQFYGTTGSAGGSTANSLFLISLSGTNAGQIVADAFGPGQDSLPIPGTGDYEGSDCFLVTPDAFSTIDGVVFWDREEDGDFDGFEPVIAGALVFLFEDVNTNGVIDVGTDSFVNFSATGTNGVYEFVVAIDKEYLVALEPSSVPADACGFTTPIIAQISYPNLCGVNVTAPDFGVRTCSVLGDFVWDDYNQNGVQDPGEPGLSNVTVNVYNPVDNSLVATTNTLPDGSYLFTQLNHSNYVVEVIPPGSYLFTTPNVGAADTDSNIDPNTGRSGLIDLTILPASPVLTFTNLTVDAGLYLESDLAILKETSPALPGSSNIVFDYVLTVTNQLDRPGVNVVITDQLPLGVDYLSDDAGGAFDPTSRVWSVTIPLLAPATATNMNLRVEITDNSVGPIQNIASVTNDFLEITLTNNTNDVFLARLGDRVWLDTDLDGVQDPSETNGVPNVVVRLYDAASNQVGQVLTDATGLYEFSVPAGTYFVEFVPPANTGFSPQGVGVGSLDSDPDPATGRTAPVTLLAGDNNPDLDAGLLPPLQLDKSVGIPFLSSTNVTFEYLLSVSNSGDLTVAPVLVEDILPDWVTFLGSDAPGASYNPGTRLFSVDLGPLGPFASASVIVTVQVVSASPAADLVNTAAVNQVVFATQTNAVLGNLVFLDRDNDSVQSGPDAGVPLAEVRLFLAGTSNQVGGTTTDPNGLYFFILPPGDYEVEFAAPPGSTFVDAGQGGDPALDSDADPLTGRSAPVTLLPAEVNLDIDAGVEVVLDIDKQAGPALPSGANVTFPYLITVSNTSVLVADPVLVEDTLPVWLSYLGSPTPGANFSNGVFSVDVGPLAPLSATTIVVNVEVTGPAPTVDLVNTASVNRIFFAEQTNAVIGDLVFQDLNTNAVYDLGTDGVVPGATVELLDVGGAQVGSTTTDTNGLYAFVVPPGTYQVRFIAPAGANFVPQDVGGDDTVDSDADPGTGLTGPFAVLPGQVDTTRDAGLTGTHTLEKTVSGVLSTGGAVEFNYVLTVSNASAIVTEPLVLEDVLPAWAQFLNDNGAGGSESNGVYSVALGSLPAGASTSIVLRVQVPNPVLPVDLTNTANVNRVLYAAQTNALLGDFVWRDGNGNGIQDPGEAGVAGVAVALRDAGGANTLADTSTDGNGFYAFVVPPGTYVVNVTPPTGTFFSLPGQGGDTALDSDVDVVSGNSAPVALVAGETNLNVDAAIQTPLELVKSVTDPLPGNTNVTFGYTLTVSNGTAVAADPVLLEDTLPLWLNYLGSSEPAATFSNGVYSVDLGPLPAFSSTTVVVNVEVTGASPAVDLVNTASVNRVIFATQTNAVIGDLVFLDVNTNNVYDLGTDGPVPGVAVELLNTNGAVVAVDVTDGAGLYAFVVPPGSYNLRFVAPAGADRVLANQGADDTVDSDADPVDGETGVFLVAPGQVDDTRDAGLTTRTTLSKTMSGVLSNGGPVEFNYLLTVSNASAIASNPLLLEDTLPVWATYLGDYGAGGSEVGGVYSVLIGSLPANTATTVVLRVQVQNATVPVDLVNTANVNRVVFATESAALIGDFVWDDLDADGVQDPLETGINGVQVQLLDAAGTNVLADTLTGPLGQYAFIVPAGSYTVRVLPVPGTEFGPRFAGGDVALDSNADPLTALSDLVTVVPGETNITIDASLFFRATINGQVREDMNNDGNTNTVTDPGIDGVSILLYEDANLDRIPDGPPVAVTNTIGGGFYTFTNLVPRTYLVVESNLTGYTSTADTEGANDDAIQVTVTSGANSGGNDFLDTRPVEIGDFVWEDSNGNGVQDLGEPGIPDVRVELLTAAGTVLGSTLTDTNGLYRFALTNTFAGAYRVRFDLTTLPVGYVVTPQDLGGDDTLDSDPDPLTGEVPALASVTLESGQTNTDFDMGIYLPAVIGDFVWIDQNNDGIQQTNELGQVDVVVQLLDTNLVVLMTTTSAVDGSYSFTGLPPGGYRVQFGVTNLPPQRLPGLQNQGGDPALDSDPDPVTGLVPGVVTLLSGQVQDTIDFAVIPLASIGDTVWWDLSADGIVTNENLVIFGIPGARVDLYLVNATGDVFIASQVTASNNLNRGFYEFPNLPPALYRAVVDPTTLPTQLSVATAPTNGFYLIDLIAGGASDIADFGFITDPTAIELQSFEGVVEGPDVRLFWSTATEFDNLGFNLYRSAAVNAKRYRINAELLLGRGTGLGADYVYMDRSVPVGTWYYWLEDVDFSLKTEIHGPVTLAMLAPTDPVDDVLPATNVGFSLDRAGIARILLAEVENTAVFVDGVEVPSLEVEGGLLVYVASTSSVVQTGTVDLPLRMEVVSSVPQAGQSTVVVADADGQVAFTTTPGTDNYLLIGFSQPEIVVLDVSDPQAPKVLVDSVILNSGSDYGAYLHLNPETPARVHAADTEGIPDVE